MPVGSFTSYYFPAMMGGKQTHLQLPVGEKAFYSFNEAFQGAKKWIERNGRSYTNLNNGDPTDHGPFPKEQDGERVYGVQLRAFDSPNKRSNYVWVTGPASAWQVEGEWEYWDPEEDSYW